MILCLAWFAFAFATAFLAVTTFADTATHLPDQHDGHVYSQVQKEDAGKVRAQVFLHALILVIPVGEAHDMVQEE